MLKYKLDSLAELDESLHAFYEEKEGVFHLMVDGAVSEDAVAGLKRNHDTLLAEKKEQQRKAEEAEAERKRIEEEAARKNGDIKSLEASWSEKLSSTEAVLNAKIEEKDRHIYNLTVGRQAQELAGKLAKPNAQRLLAREIQERLTLEGDEIRVLDKQGKLSAMSLVELEQELRLNPEYADIIIINNSSGGGATGGGLGGGAAKKPNEMTVQERQDLLERDPVLFRQLFPLK